MKRGFLGAVGIGQAETLRPALSLFQVYSVPVILATPNAASELPPQPNVMTTAPTMASIVQVKKIFILGLCCGLIHNITFRIKEC